MDLNCRITRRFNITNVVGDVEFYPVNFGADGLIRNILRIHLFTPKLHSTLFYNQMDRFDAMDLATRNSPGAYWDKRIFTHLTRSLPPMTAEHLLEVRRLDRGSMLHRLYKRSFVQLARFRYGDELDGLLDEVLEPYERRNGRELRDMDQVDRTRAEVQDYLQKSRRYMYSRHTVFPTLLPKIVFINDSALTVKVLQTLFNVEWTRELLFAYVGDVNTLRVLICHAKEQRFDFWGLMRGTGRLAERYNPVVEYLDEFNRHHRLARILLRFGFQYSAQKLVYEAQRRAFNAVDCGIPVINTHDNYYERIREMLSIDTYYVFEQEKNEFLRASTLKRVIWSIPEPHPTPQQLQNTLQSIVQNKHTDTLHRVALRYAVYRIQEEIELTPRQLQHLCRCKIRDVLRSYLRLPEGIDQLPEINKVKFYLWYLKLE